MSNTYTTDRVINFPTGSLATSLPVYLSPKSTILQPDTQVAVPASTVTTITTYTNATADVQYLDGWVATGQYEGLWQLLIDTSFKDERRTSASNMNVGVQYATPIRIAPGSTVDIKVEHYGTGTGQFSATIFGHTQ
jgi:hypothetical protein